MALFKKKTKSALFIKKEYHSEGVLFVIMQDNNFVNLPVHLTASEAKNAVNLDQLQFIEELYFDDNLHWVEQGSYVLPYDVIYKMNEEERGLLDVPEKEEPVTIFLNNESFAGAANFEFVPEIHSKTYPHLHKVGKRFGAIMCLPTQEDILLEQNVYRFLEDVEQVPDKTSEYQLLRYAARIKNHAQAIGIPVSEHIDRENYEFIDDVDISVERTSEGVNILPEYKHSQLSDKEINAVANSSNGYDIVDNKRLFVGSEAQTKAEQIKNVSSIKGSDVPKFVENPAAFVPEDIEVSLDDFGERVKNLGIRVYKAQPFVHANEIENGWFEYDTGFNVKDAEGTTVTKQQEDYFTEEETQDGFKRVDEDTFVSVPDHAEAFQQISSKIKEDAAKNPTNKSNPSEYILEIFENIQGVEFNQPLQEMKETLVDNHVFDKGTPATFLADLKPFQEDGYVWMKMLHSTNYGGLLADDMGLGKTIQVIAYLTYLDEKDQLSPTLLILPKSLIENWRNEISKFSPKLAENLYVHLGQNRYKDQLTISEFDLVLTTYQTLVRDQLILGRIDWKTVVCDEAQNIKNPTTSTSAAVKAMKNEGRFALTGTPVENSLTELWSIIDFVQPGRLGSLNDFKQQYESSSSKGESYERIRESIENKIGLIYKRRTKTHELQGQLPHKFEKRLFVKMGKIQKELYDDIIQSVHNKQLSPLQGVMNLKMIASHPALADSSLKYLKPDKVPKLEETLKILRGIQPSGEKAIIFTEYRIMQSILKNTILNTFDINPPIINGDSNGRQMIVNEFNNTKGFQVMILSPKSAGTGLTITGANHVIHYTRWWNPAVENQATDRVYRIGQEKDVHVYYPIVESDLEENTAEQIIDNILSQKKELANNVIVPSKDMDITNEILERIPELK